MKEKVLETIRKYQLIDTGDKIVLAVSGGPDSMAMLDILNEIRKEKNEFEIIVAHLNHLIRKEAKEEQEYVKQYCQEKNIVFYTKSIDVKKLANNNKIGIEEAGRMARYQFFNEVLQEAKANKIAIAHNKNDRAETIFMNLLRGSGINGLKGIEAKRDQYIRPLIECERIEIENYCDQKNLNPKIDKSNQDNNYTRNKIRNCLIPYVQKEFNPNIIRTLNRLGDLAYEEEEYLEKQVKNIYEKLCLSEKEKQIVLDLKTFNQQEKVIKAKLVLYTITRLFKTTQGIEKIHIEDILKLCQNNIGNKYLTPNKNIKVWVKNHKIYFIDQR